MQLDIFTLLTASVAVWLTLGLLHLFLWNQDRNARWLVWWGAPYLMGAVASVLYMGSETVPSPQAMSFGTALITLGFGCQWQGARVFEHRKPVLWPLVAWVAAWFFLFAIPGFNAVMGVRVVIASVASALFLALAAAELRRGRGEKLPSRNPLIVVLLVGSLFYAGRIVSVGILPMPLGAQVPAAWAVGVFNIFTFLLAVFVTAFVISLSKERNEARQRSYAQTDALTGLLNRRAFADQSERLIRRHKHAGAPLALLMIDLDQFKSINDRFGHDAGDRVLVAFAGMLQDTVRPGDRVFRLGGEEFCCLLPGATLRDAREIADRICQNTRAISVEVRDGKLSPTASIGVASTDICEHDAEELLGQADAAVYEAKASGRDKVMEGRERRPQVG